MINVWSVGVVSNDNNEADTQVIQKKTGQGNKVNTHLPAINHIHPSDSSDTSDLAQCEHSCRPNQASRPMYHNY